MKRLTELIEWTALTAHHKSIEKEAMLNWFAQDSFRAQRFSLQFGDIFFDYSKNRITSETVQLLFNLATSLNLSEKIDNLFSGFPLNSTESRPALHTALRNCQPSDPVFVNGKNVMLDILATQSKMRQFTDLVRTGTWLGCTGKPIQSIVNIGIGGSHLGPQMVAHALAHYGNNQLDLHFVSNIDSAHINEVFRKIDPETSLFIISSKSFTTLETITNAHTFKNWMAQKLGTNDLTQHFVAVTAQPNKAVEFGIPENQIFLLWDWVGGRYSVWSAIGLPLALLIGMDLFLEFLAGAHEMDMHFRQAPFSENMPVIMALLGVWYINFFHAKSHAIVPYSYQLNFLRAHLQQLDMESNGKCAQHQGTISDYTTGPIIWGEQGCTGQHAFHQLLHQGQHLVPVDFILVSQTNECMHHNQDILIASGLSQAQALLHGKTVDLAYEELIKLGYQDDEAKWLAFHKAIPGNRPSNILFVKEITPKTLGSLLALYEHKIFVQGIIWNINSFDQWGVELGKQLLPSILSDLKNAKTSLHHDASTFSLIEHYKKLREPT